MKQSSMGLVALLLLPVLPAWTANSDSQRILVVVDRAVPAYREAADGLKRGLADLGGAVAETSPAGAAGALQSAPVRLVVAVGADARSALARTRTALPVISTMISLIDPDGDPLAKPAGSIYLDLDVGQIAHEVSRLFPERKRLGLILNSRKNGPNKIVAARLAQEGFQLTTAISANRAGLVEAFKELKGKADLVLCLPETGLFDSRTIPLLLRVSLEDQLPVIGFSPGFVRAGALAGVFPDYADIGLQTAEMARRALSNPSADAGDETPRRVASVTNATVMRLLGWKLTQVHPQRQ